MKREKLTVEKREILGKKIKKLRKEGILPANVYGKDMPSIAIQLPLTDFQEVYKVAHETGLVDIVVNGETFPILIHNVQIDPRTRTALHADFFKVNLKEKITARIPVIAVGEPKAEIDKIGLLEQPVMELEVEALPTDLPEKFEIDVAGLAEVDQQIIVSDIKVDAAVTVLSEPSQVVFKIGELVTKEMEEQMAADEAETEAAQEEAAEGEEGEKAEGEEKSEEAAEGEEGEKAEGEEKSEEAAKE